MTLRTDIGNNRTMPLRHDVDVDRILEEIKVVGEDWKTDGICQIMIQGAEGKEDDVYFGSREFKEIAESFMNFLNKDILVIHNAKFDLGFLNSELAEADLPLINIEKTIDTVQMARQKTPGAPASLDALCKRFDIDISKREKHGALLDAQLLAEVYLELTGGRQGNFVLNKPDSSFKTKNLTHNKENKRRMIKRMITILLFLCLLILAEIY